MTSFEIGYTKGNVLSIILKTTLTILRTWWFARSRGLPHDKWYGVYYAGTEIKIADFGCLPSAADNASKFLIALYMTDTAKQQGEPTP